MKRQSLFLVLAVFFAAPTLARADSPRISSDGLYLGARFEPGVAFTLAYDLDVYLSRDRFVSIGPAASMSFLGSNGSELGRRQDYLLAVDVARLKISLTQEPSTRTYILVGGGFDIAHLPAQEGSLRDVTLASGTVASARLTFPEQSSVNGLISVGLGFDAYLNSHFGLATALVSHIRVGGDDRVPRFWAELLFGFRFGL